MTFPYGCAYTYVKFIIGVSVFGFGFKPPPVRPAPPHPSVLVILEANLYCMSIQWRAGRLFRYTVTEPPAFALCGWLITMQLWWDSFFYFWFNKLVSFFPFPLLDPLMVSCCAKLHCMKPTLYGVGMRPPWLALTTQCSTQFFLVLHDPLISFSLVFTSIYTRKNMAHLSNCTDGVQGVVQTHSAA